MNKIDLVTAEIIRSKCLAIVQDMNSVMVNTSRSATLSQSRDFSNSLLTEDGSLVAIDNAMQLGVVPHAAAAILDYFQFDMLDGDVVVANDPYTGGTHVQDLTMLSPLYWENEVMMHLMVRAHMADFGGMYTGGYNPRAKEVWAEGVRITPVKLYRAGAVQRDVLTCLLLNSRFPDVVKGDIGAMLAAVEVAKRQIYELNSKYGAATVRQSMEESINYTERRFRAEIENWPDGGYPGESKLDHDCHGKTGLGINVLLRVLGNSLELDFSNSDPQSEGFVNSALANTHGYALLPLFTVLDESMPRNAGILRPIHLKTKEGTVVDPIFPAPTGWCPVYTGAEVAKAVAQALQKCLPRKAGSVSISIPMITSLGTTKEWGILDHSAFSQGSCSGAWGCDGWGMPGPFSQVGMPSIEMHEAQFHGFVAKMELLTDSGGAGRWRGGLGTETVFRFNCEDASLTVCMEGREFPSEGFAGGSGGTPNRVVYSRGEMDKDIDKILFQEPISHGSQLCIQMGGGGAWGNPLERDPQMVLSDVLNEYVSIGGAKRDYGVVIDPAKMEVDLEATRHLRSQMHG